MSWESHRGDQWWYSGAVGRIEGYLDGSTFMVGAIKADSSSLDKEVMHSFLFATKRRFINCQVSLQGDRDVTSLLEELKAEGLIDYFVPREKYGDRVSLNSVSWPAWIGRCDGGSGKIWWRFWGGFGCAS